MIAEHEVATQFRDAIRAAGVDPPDEIVADGRIHRFSANGKRSDRAGWYCLHTDEYPAGVFGNWRDSSVQTWRYSNGRDWSVQDEAAFRAMVAKAKAERDIAQAAEQAEAAQIARALYEGASADVSGHPYARRKRVCLGPMVRRGAWSQNGWDDALLVPIFQADGALSCLQAISPQGTKRFWQGRSWPGGFMLSGGSARPS